MYCRQLVILKCFLHHSYHVSIVVVVKLFLLIDPDYCAAKYCTNTDALTVYWPRQMMAITHDKLLVSIP